MPVGSDTQISGRSTLEASTGTMLGSKCWTGVDTADVVTSVTAGHSGEDSISSLATGLLGSITAPEGQTLLSSPSMLRSTSGARAVQVQYLRSKTAQGTSVTLTSPSFRLDSAAFSVERGLSGAESGSHLVRAATASNQVSTAGLGEDGATGVEGNEGVIIDEYDATCGVCFDDEGDFLALRPCSHKLCVACATELVKLHHCDPVPCPFCRAFIRGFEA